MFAQCNISCTFRGHIWFICIRCAQEQPSSAWEDISLVGAVAILIPGHGHNDSIDMFELSQLFFSVVLCVHILNCPQSSIGRALALGLGDRGLNPRRVIPKA